MSTFEYARRLESSSRPKTARDRGISALRAWLRSSYAFELLDAAVLGTLERDWAAEVAADYGLDLEQPADRKTFRRELDAALGEGF